MKKLNRSFAFILSSLILLAISLPLFSQEALKSIEEEYYDFLALQGLVERPTLGYRTLSDSKWELSEESKNDERNIWKNNNLGTTRQLSDKIAFKFYGPEWYNSYNTKTPYGQNDGALWQGKGYNTSFTSGVRFEGYGFELTFKPQLSWSQNKEFELMDNSAYYTNKYAYFWGYGNNAGIDLPQRFGDSSYGTFDWGDTEIRYTWKTFTTGFGTQAIWLGPAWLNPMLGSNNAPSYPKFDIGMRKTEIGNLGYIEGRIWLGMLTESDYFDNNDTNNKNLLTGFSASYAPSIFPGLTLTINKICLSKWNDKSVKYLNPLYHQNSPTNGEDQKLSLAADYIFPEVGFEVYGEFGKDDYSDKQTNPFHTGIYTIGARKIFSIFKKWEITHELIFELNNFEMSQDFQLQWKYIGYYGHHIITQGYTQRGQILGAGSGYLGNSQYLGLKTFYPKGNTTIFIHYNRPDNNFIHNLGLTTKNSDWASNEQWPMHEKWAVFKTIRTLGINTQLFVSNNMLIGASIKKTDIFYPYYISKSFSKNYTFTFNIKYNL